MARTRLRGGRITLVRRFAAAWIAAVVVLVVVQTLMPQRSGVLALTEVLEPYIVLTAIAAAPFAMLGRDRLGVAVVVVLAAVVVVRYAPGFIGGPSDPDSAQVSVTAWNVEAGSDGARRIVDGLATIDSDLVALEELQPEMARGVTADARLSQTYPFQALAPDTSVLGVGLLSRYPILEQWFSQTQQPRSTSAPPYMRALVQLPGTGPTAVFVVHPLPARFETFAGIPYGLDTTQRDAGLEAIRAMVDVDLAAGTPVVVMGDFNTTEREPAYQEFSRGFHDARRHSGSWPGLTWRPDSLVGIPFGLLRIDYVFSSPQVVPVNYAVTCTNLSDHCIVTASLRYALVD